MKYASGSSSYGICDRCGLRYPYLSLREEWTKLVVCESCWESKHPQLSPKPREADAQALYRPRPERKEPVEVAVGMRTYPRSNSVLYGLGRVGDVSFSNDMVISRYTLAVATGIYTLTGKDAQSSKNVRHIIATPTFFTLAGQPATLGKVRVLGAETGFFNYAGKDALLTRNQKVLTAAQASFALTGKNAALKKAYKLAAARGSFGVSVPAFSLVYGSKTTVQDSLWYPNAPAGTAETEATSGVVLGTQMYFNAPGTIQAVAIYRSSTSAIGSGQYGIWRVDNGTNTLLASGSYSGMTGTGWKTVNLATPLTVDPTFTYVVGVLFLPNAGNVYYQNVQNYFSSAETDSPKGYIVAPIGDGSSNASRGITDINGLYSYSTTLKRPTSSFNASTYFIDVVFQTSSTASQSTTLKALSLSGTGIQEKSAQGTVIGTVGNKTTSSQLNLVNTYGGRFQLVGNSLQVGATQILYADATSYSIEIDETLAGASNSPRQNTFTITVKQAVQTGSVLYGFPDAKSTGIQAGVTLTTRTTDIDTSANGQVIQGYYLQGAQINVNHSNVTIRNCKIDGKGADKGIYIPDTGQKSVIVEYCEIFNVKNGIAGHGEFRFNNIHDIENGINFYNTSYVHDNFIHSMNFAGDPHYDAFELNYGDFTGTIIEHNSAINDNIQTSAVMLGRDADPAAFGVTIRNNYLAGGGYTIYCRDSSNVVENNYLGEGQQGGSPGAGYLDDQDSFGTHTPQNWNTNILLGGPPYPTPNSDPGP